MTETGRRRVLELSPGLAGVLHASLVADGRFDLVDTVEELEAQEPRSCGDAFCTSCYTGPRPDGRWGPDHENLVYDLAEGMLVLDVVDGVIRFVEVLDRPTLVGSSRRPSRQDDKRTYENRSENNDLVLKGYQRSRAVTSSRVGSPQARGSWSPTVTR